MVVAGVVSLLISGVDIPGDVWAALPWTLAWFVAGFIMYGFLFAMAGAMVSRQEDAQSAAIPVTVLLMTGYMAMFVFVGDPGRTVAKVMSTVPFFAPLLQPMRIAAGEAPSSTWPVGRPRRRHDRLPGQARRPRLHAAGPSPRRTGPMGRGTPPARL